MRHPLFFLVAPIALSLLTFLPNSSATESDDRAPDGAIPRTAISHEPVQLDLATRDHGLLRRRPHTAEERALLEIRREGQHRVRDISARLHGLPDGSARRELQRRVVRLKREYEILFLRTKARFARDRGDLAAVDEIEQLMERILNPRPLGKTPGEKSPAQKGGRP
jgi:hypothetical protein